MLACLLVLAINRLVCVVKWLHKIDLCFHRIWLIHLHRAGRGKLDLIVERAASLPALLILTFRPEFQPPWSGLPQVTTLALNRLDPRTGAEMIAGIAGDRPLPTVLAAEIVARADGVPLFVEELARAFIEAGGSGAGVDRTLLGAPPPSAAVASAGRSGPRRSISATPASPGSTPRAPHRPIPPPAAVRPLRW